MSSRDYLDSCRLCLGKDKVSIPIFDSESNLLACLACLQIKLEEDDKLPNKICRGCEDKLKWSNSKQHKELFDEFINTISNSDEKLMRLLDQVDVNDKQTQQKSSAQQNDSMGESKDHDSDNNINTNEDPCSQILVGEQNIKEVITAGIYVDKTSHIEKWLKGSPRNLLINRPRRFGKTLLVTTISEICKGPESKELFKNCSIGKGNYKWPKYPVISLDFSLLENTTEEFEQSLNEQLQFSAEKNNLNMSFTGNALINLGDFIRILSNKSETANKIVILIDSYDEPLSRFEKEDELYKFMKEKLRNFFNQLKSASAEGLIQLTFITGICSVPIRNMSSGANYIPDVSLYSEYSDLFGFTENDIKSVYCKQLKSLAEQHKKSEDELFKEIRGYYKGYKFSDEGIPIFNPWSILNFLRFKKFDPFWCHNRHLNTMFRNWEKYPKQFSKLLTADKIEIGSNELLGYVWSPENFNITAMMYQSGFLTIDTYDMSTRKFTLCYPNLEVEEHAASVLESTFSSIHIERGWQNLFVEALHNKDYDTIIKLLNDRLFWHRNYLPTGHKEAACEDRVMGIISGFNLGIENILTVKNQFTVAGRNIADIVLMTPNIIYVLELKYYRGTKTKYSVEYHQKLESLVDDGMEQIQEKGYALHFQKEEEYTKSGREIVSGSIVFHDRLIKMAKFADHGNYENAVILDWINRKKTLR